MMRNSRCRSFSCFFSVGKRSGCADGSSTICAKITARAAAKRPPRPPQMQRARVPVPDRLLPRRGFVDRVERQRDFDELLARIASCVFLAREQTRLTEPLWRLQLPSLREAGDLRASSGRGRCRRAPRPRASCARKACRGDSEFAARLRPWHRAWRRARRPRFRRRLQRADQVVNNLPRGQARVGGRIPGGGKLLGLQQPHFAALR